MALRSLTPVSGTHKIWAFARGKPSFPAYDHFVYRPTHRVFKESLMSDQSAGNIDTVMHETRLFPPSPEFAGKVSIGSMEAYQALYDEAKADIG